MLPGRRPEELVAAAVHGLLPGLFLGGVRGFRALGVLGALGL